MTAPVRRRRCGLLRTRPLRLLLLGAAAVAVAGCATSLDLERARRMLRRNRAPALPVLQVGAPTADLPGPERLRATGGELRKVPLHWDPILVGDVGGYQVERASDADGPFEPIAAVPGALTTTHIDRLGNRGVAERAPDPAAALAAAEPEDPALSPTAAEPEEASDQPSEPAAASDAEPAASAPGAGGAADAPAAGAGTSAPDTGTAGPEAAAEPGAEPGSEAVDPEAAIPPVPEEIALLGPVPPPDRSRGPDGRTLYYRVRAFTPAGQLARNTSEVVAATTALLPAPPEDLRAFSHQPRRVPLSWRASQDRIVAGYRVYRSPTSLGPFEVIADLEGRHTTTYTDDGLGDLRVFYYRVAGLNAAGGEGVPTEPVRVVTKPEPLPPVGLRVVARRLGANELAWEPNVEPDITEYRLLRQREGAQEPERVSTVSQGSTVAVDTAVGAGEKVRYSVTAFDRDGLVSAAGESIAVTSEGYDLRATAGPQGVELTWNPRTDEGFRAAQVFRGGVFDQREFPRVAGSRFVDTDVRPGRRYRYSVALVDAAGRLAPRSRTVEVEVPEAD